MHPTAAQARTRPDYQLALAFGLTRTLLYFTSLLDDKEVHQRISIQKRPILSHVVGNPLFYLV